MLLLAIGSALASAAWWARPSWPTPTRRSRRRAGHRGRTDPRCRLDRDLSRAFETVSRPLVSATVAGVHRRYVLT
jgi:hypothetical protein